MATPMDLYWKGLRTSRDLMGYINRDLIMSPVLLAQQSWMQLTHAESMSAQKEDGRSSSQNRRGPGARPLLPLQGAIPWEVRCAYHGRIYTTPKRSSEIWKPISHMSHMWSSWISDFECLLNLPRTLQCWSVWVMMWQGCDGPCDACGPWAYERPNDVALQAGFARKNTSFSCRSNGGGRSCCCGVHTWQAALLPNALPGSWKFQL